MGKFPRNVAPRVYLGKSSSKPKEGTQQYCLLAYESRMGGWEDGNSIIHLIFFPPLMAAVL